MTRFSPAGTVPKAHGNAVVHAVLLAMKVKPAGVGSVTVTPVALEGPLLVTVMV